MTAPFRGQAVPMVDGRARVTGELRYSLNVELPGMLQGRVLRSTLPHARVLAVDTSRAERLPGVGAVISRNDLDEGRHQIHFGPVILDQTPMALDKVLYVGAAVAGVAAVDASVAAEAVSLIDVEYEELPAVFDPEAALGPDAPILHEGPRRIPGRADVRARSSPGTNIVHRFTLRRGDVEAGLANAEHVFEAVYDSQVVSHVALEPHNAVVDVRDDLITVWTSTQSPNTIQAQIAELFRLPLSRVRVIVHTLGGGYGGKSNAKLEPIAALLSAKARQPVQIVASRAETFVLASQHAARIRSEVGVAVDGTLLAQRTRCYFNTGPYADTTPMIITRGYGATGPYRVRDVHVDSYGVYTNSPPASAFRGFGATQVAWANESHMDEIADALGLDPLELRLKNILRTGDVFATGESMPELHYAELLRDAAAAIGWRPGELVARNGPVIRAKGIAAILKGMAGPTTSTCALKLHGDGSLSVLAASVEMGQGSNTALSQIAADALSVSLDKVRVLAPDTESTPFDQMTASSRTTYCMGVAIGRAADEIARQLRSLAAEEFEAAEDDLVLVDERVMVRGDPTRAIPYADLIRRNRQGNLLGRGTFVAKDNPEGHEVGLDLETGQGHGAAAWHPAVVGCEVEVDTETGRISVIRLHASLYAGRLINPRLCELQVEGSAVFGLGQALFEDVVIDSNGRVVNPNLSDYMIPSFSDLPAALTVHLLQPPGVDEVHGIGEAALPPVAPAIGNAVSRAIGARIRELPLTPERVLRALAAAAATASATSMAATGAADRGGA